MMWSRQDDKSEGKVLHLFFEKVVLFRGDDGWDGALYVISHDDSESDVTIH